MMEPDRAERILALVLFQQMKGEPLREKVVKLNVAGFSNVEIADIVQTTPGVVAQLLYESRKKGGKGKAAAKKTASRTRRS